MKYLTPLVALVAALVLPAGAQAVTLVDQQGQPVGGQFQAWADQSKVPTLPGKLSFTPYGCGVVGGAAYANRGCSWGPIAPYTTQPNTPQTFWTGAADQYTLYFELGHQFDWQLLTANDRAYLARMWGVPRAAWWDNWTIMETWGEDGLEADFAAAYQDCAYGQTFDSITWLTNNPSPPTITQSDPGFTCDFIRQVASGHHAPALAPAHKAHAKARKHYGRVSGTA